MFKITRNKGFHITFENGWTVSVQFGGGNYCDNFNMNGFDEAKAGEKGSKTAECAVWGPKGEMVRYKDWGGASVSNRSTPAEVLRLMNWASKQK
jgi:hypothetical protein